MALEKAMCKFFPELLQYIARSQPEGDARHNKHANNRNVQLISVNPMGARKRVTERHGPLFKAFPETQMYIQWKESDYCDFLFDLPVQYSHLESFSHIVHRSPQLHATRAIHRLKTGLPYRRRPLE